MTVRHVVLANSHLHILKLGLRTKNNSYPFVWERKIDLKGSTPVSAKTRQKVRGAPPNSTISATLLPCFDHVGLILEKYDFKKVGLIPGVGTYTGGAYNERGV